MNEMKPEDVMRALENGRYIDADELWNSRPENINREGNFIDGWFYCLDGFSRHLKEMINKPSVTKAALALLREKDADINGLEADNEHLTLVIEGKMKQISRMAQKIVDKDAEIERLKAELGRKKETADGSD